MRPLSELTKETAAGLRGLLFDLDDTLLSHGLLTREAFGALWDLHDAGLRLIAVTGRPSGWGEVIARQWPIDGVVAENGAILIKRERPGASAIAVIDPCSAAERASRRVRLQAIALRVREVVPEAELADDVRARLSDVTWDIGERTKLSPERVHLVVQEIARAGARSTQSSVHVHATFDPDDKATGAITFLRETFGEDAGAARSRYAFVGDSGNDATCFAAFLTTFGVSNVRGHLGRIVVTPRFCAEGAMGAGFAEIARTLLERRKGAS